MFRSRVRRWLTATLPDSGRALTSLIVIAILLAMTGGITVNLINQLLIARHLEQELTNAQAEVRALYATTQMLEDRLNYELSDAAVELWARDTGMAREGDTVIVPEMAPTVAPVSVPVVTVTPAPLPPLPPNWQRWWQAFFP
ncbi:MAG: septum formation initiator family protein [Chloroflexus sp.]